MEEGRVVGETGVVSSVGWVGVFEWVRVELG